MKLFKKKQAALSPNDNSNCNILFLYSRCFSYIGAVDSYINAFKLHSQNRVIFHDPDCGLINESYLNGFDVIIVNYCVVPIFHSLPKSFFDVLKRFDGLKIAIIQDEYDNAIIQRKKLIHAGLDCIITTIPNSDDYHKVYYGKEFAQVDFISAFTGYVTEDMQKILPPIPFEQRKWKIGYRGRSLALKYGQLGREKYLIGKKMKEICEQRNVCANIAVDEESRIYGAAWPEFIRNCCATLGTESGSNVFDFDNKIVPAIKDYMEKNSDADFETIHNLFLKDIDGKIIMNQVSPRIFEAVSLGTALILFEGTYSGVVEPWKHFIPLKKDFSNVDEVLNSVNNIPLLEKMTRQAYDDVIASDKYTYATFISQIDKYIAGKLKKNKNMSPIYILAGWRDDKGNAIFDSNMIIDRPTMDMLTHKDVFRNFSSVGSFKKLFTHPDFFRQIRIAIPELLRPCDKLYKTVRWIYRKIKKVTNIFVHNA